MRPESAKLAALRYAMTVTVIRSAAARASPARILDSGARLIGLWRRRSADRGRPGYTNDLLRIDPYRLRRQSSYLVPAMGLSRKTCSPERGSGRLRPFMPLPGTPPGILGALPIRALKTGDSHVARRTLLPCAVLLVMAIASPARAHVGLDEQIAGLTRRIAQEPGDASLYLRRGEVRRLLGEWDEAMADYRKAGDLDPRLAAVDLCRGRTWLEAGHPRRARAALDLYLAGRPDDPEALALRARALEKVRDHLAAAADLTRAIALGRPPRLPDPDDYLARARALAAAGPAHLDDAVRGLDEGLEALGQPVALALLAIDLEAGR